MLLPHFAPEQCGVSDYSVSWKSRMGNTTEIFIAALSDKYNPGILEQPGLLRMGADIPLDKRLSLLAGLLDQNHFDEIVIHYVPHGYKPNGLPLWLTRLARLLKRKSVPVILLAHEIWMGGPGKPLRTRVKGLLQKRLLLKIVRLLNTDAIITTSEFTARQLQQEGLVADWCPVFSNLGTVSDPSGLPASVSGILQHQSHTCVLMFGAIPPDTAPADFTGFFKMLWLNYQKPILLIHAGHADIHPLEGLERTFSNSFDLKLVILGPLPGPVLNALMQQCQFGVSTYPIQLWSKSGSIAAMLANALPVAVLGRLPGEPFPKPGSIPAGILPWKILEESQRGAYLNQHARSAPILKEYNENIAVTLYALTGLGREKKKATEFKPSYTVLITVYRCWPQAAECIRSLQANASIDRQTEILVINDDPANPVPASIEKLEGVSVVNNPTNLGYVASVNRGVNLAKGNIILLLDADAFLQTSIEPALMLFAGDNEAKLLIPGCQLTDGTNVRRLYPEPHVVSMLFGQGFEGWWMKNSRSPQVVSHSYAWFFRRSEFLALGGFDERLNFLEADVEFCMRLQRSFPGGIRSCRVVKVIHDGGANPIHRNQRVFEWYKSRWFILGKHNAIPFRVICKGFISIRLQIELVLAVFFARLQPARTPFWRQKSDGRKMLLKDLKNW